MVLAASIVSNVFLIASLRPPTDEQAANPDYVVEVGPEGTSLIIAGDLSEGIASAVERALDANPGITRVYLNSVGGQAGEAIRLAGLFRERHLTTLAPFICYLDCTVAFAGGRTRVVGPMSQFGFAPQSLVDGPATYAAMDQVYRIAGFRTAFLEQIEDTPADTISRPSPMSLWDANVANDFLAMLPPEDFPTEPFFLLFADAYVLLDLDLPEGLAVTGMEPDGTRLNVELSAASPDAIDGLGANGCDHWLSALAVRGDDLVVLVIRDRSGVLLRTIAMTPDTCT